MSCTEITMQREIKPLIMRGALSRVLFILILFLIAFTATSCVTTNEPTVAIGSPEDSISEFFDNTNSYIVTGASEQAILNLVINSLKLANERNDLSLTEPLLSNDFDQIIIDSEYEFFILNREEYLDLKTSWASSDNLTQAVQYAIQKIILDDEGIRASVVLLSTYEQKHFRQRFIETLHLQNIGGIWKLRRRVMARVYVENPELHEVEVFVAREAWPQDEQSQQSWMRYSGSGEIDKSFAPNPPKERGAIPLQKLFPTLVRDGRPDDIVNIHQKGAIDSLPLYIGVSVLFVFRDPPAIGSIITTELIYKRPYGEFPFRYEYAVEKGVPYFVIENLTRSDDEGGDFVIRLYINGQLVAEKILPA